MGMTAEALVELQKVFKAAEENEGGLLDQVRFTHETWKVNCIQECASFLLLVYFM